MREMSVSATQKVPWWRCRRYWLAVLLFFGFTLFSVTRANLSIIIVCMVKHGGRNVSHVTSYNSTGNTTEVSVDLPNTCAKTADVHNLDDSQDGEFEWDKELQGILLGGYFWGYGSGMQILGGWLSQRYGSRTMVTLGLLPQAIGALLSPLAVRVSPYLFLVIRVISGAGGAVMFPSAPVFWSHWAPPDEWSRLLASSYAGGEFGHALAFPINGFLCSYGGWELPFYIMGGVCVLWCLLWYVLSRDSPSQMPGITETEKNYLTETIGQRVSSERKYKTPWRSIFKSVPVWACVSCHVLANFFFYMLMTQVPTYLKEVMKFDIQSNGLYLFLPYIALFSFIMPIGILTDYITSKEYLCLGAVRKLFNTLGMVLPAACLLGLAYVPCTNPTAGVALITAALGAFSFCFSGHIVNMADIAVMHSGIVAGLSNTLASFPGIIAPYVVGYVTRQGSQEEWRTAFFIAIVLNVIGGLVFLLFSSGVPQPWAIPPALNITKAVELADELEVIANRRDVKDLNDSDELKVPLTRDKETILLNTNNSQCEDIDQKMI